MEAHGFAPTSPYVEFVWLGVLGPTASWLYRRLGMIVIASPDGRVIDLGELASSLGVGGGLGRHSPMLRSIDRLVRFGVAQTHPSVLLVRRALAPLPEMQALNLPPSVRRVHDRLTDRVGG